MLISTSERRLFTLWGPQHPGGSHSIQAFSAPTSSPARIVDGIPNRVCSTPSLSPRNSTRPVAGSETRLQYLYLSKKHMARSRQNWVGNPHITLGKLAYGMARGLSHACVCTCVCLSTMAPTLRPGPIEVFSNRPNLVSNCQCTPPTSTHSMLLPYWIGGLMTTGSVSGVPRSLLKWECEIALTGRPLHLIGDLPRLHLYLPFKAGDVLLCESPVCTISPSPEL